MPAPVVLFCFNRPHHLRTTLNHLVQCSLASETVLYCYSDGPREGNNADIKNVRDVRNILNSTEGFKEIIRIYSNANKGLASSVIEGVSEVIKRHGVAIVLEDDLIMSTDFLIFMNNALKKYKSNKRIGSISGYSFLLEKITEDVKLVAVKRASSWGWATWHDRWEDVDWEITQGDKVLTDRTKLKDFARAGQDQIAMLVKKKRGIINSWAICWTFYHYTENLYCLVPTASKIVNIGTDGSGSNFTSSTRKYNTKLSDCSITLPDSPESNLEIDSFIENYFRPSLFRRLINFVKFSV